MTAVLILESLAPELESTSGQIIAHILALHELGVEIVVSVSAKGRVLADTLEDHSIPYRVTYSDISIEGTDTPKYTNPLAGTGHA